MGSNVLILVEDALRYDLFYGKLLQPLRDYLGPVEDFENWYSVSNCSDPNFATMLTGLYPWEHGVRFMGQRLSRKIPTLFSTFHALGHLTMFSGWGRHKVIYGMDWDMSIYAPGHIADVRPRITPNLKAMLCGVKRDVPWFAFVRHMWCHARYVDGSYLNSLRTTAKDLIDLISWIRERFPDTIVIITADHGEMLGAPKGPRRGHIDAPATGAGHSWGLFEPIIHVPMIVSHPDAQEAVHSPYFQHTDLVGLALGRIILPRSPVLLEGTGVDPKSAGWYHRGVVDNGVKFVLGGKDGAQDPLLYFSNAEGIDESHNEAQAFPEMVATMSKRLPPHVVYTPAEEQVVLDRLAALGYEG